MTPEQFPQRILFVVTGMSPQVLTETLHALIHQRPAFVPTEVHLISTVSGARHARLNLLEGNAQFLRFCNDYRVDASIFDPSRIHVISDADGAPLDDIRTPADNEAAADFITGLVRDHTAREDAAVHVSMAGGRKTMGYYAGYALSLYGRDQDRLSHVLVSEGFENQRDFYYPTPESHPIYREGGPALDAAEAQVELASIPFVRLRDELPAKVCDANPLLGGSQSFTAAVAAAELARNPVRMLLDLDTLRFEVGGQPLEGIGAADLSLLCWLALRQADGSGNLDRKDLGDEGKGKALGRDYAAFCQRLQDRDDSLANTEREAGGRGELRLPELAKVIEATEERGFVSADDFDYRLSKLKKALRRSLGQRLSEQFAPRNFGRRSQANYGFADFDDHFQIIQRQ